MGVFGVVLGAQKTIENLVGSLTLIADRPVRVGDFCRFDGTMGTIVDIGIRSTRVRTLEGTYVTIPNGAFASMQIENYAFREEFLFNTTLTLRYETTNEQIKSVLEKLRAFLLEEPKVKRDPFRVRFVELGAHSLDIEIFCYVEAKDYAAFLEIKEQLLLGVVDIIREKGADFAFPSQTIYLGKDNV